MFNLENAIQTWKRSLKQSPAFEEGQIKEVETHLRDHIDHLVVEGLPEEEAFRRAAEKFGAPDDLEDEVYKTKTTKADATPPWKKQSWFNNLLPNYLKTAARNLKRNRGYTLINIFGLTVGLAAFVLIGLFIKYEQSFDTFHEKSDRTYNVVMQFPEGTFFGGAPRTATPAPLPQTLQEEVPEVEAATLVDINSLLLIKDQRSAFEDGIASNQQFFQVFFFQWLQGDQDNALSDPSSIVLTKSLAQKYFPDQNPIGKTIDSKLWGRGEKIIKTVTGVIEDIPANAHFSFDYIISVESDQYYRRNLSTSSGWTNYNYYTYFSLKPGASITEIQGKVTNLLQDKMHQSAYYSDKSADQLPEFKYMPLRDIRLHSSDIAYPIAPQGSMQIVLLFGAIALIILLIACVNYMNLATARSVQRSKEVGIRKTAGASRFNLLTQFVIESVLVTGVSMFLAMLAVYYLLPYLNKFIGYEIPVEMLFLPGILVTIAGVWLLVGLIAGSYPAFVLSSMNPSKVLKKVGQATRGNIRLRNFLVVGQFTVTIILMICTIVIYQQIDFIQNKDTGFKRDQILVLNARDDNVRERFDTFKNEIERHPQISHISSAQNLPIDINQRTGSVDWTGKPQDSGFDIHASRVNYDFVELFDLELVAGRSFSQERDVGGQFSFILNKQAIKEIGWEPDEAVGKRFVLWGNEGEVVGIIDDFNFKSFREEINPLVLMLRPESSMNYFFIKLNTEEIRTSLSFIEENLRSFSPEYPFDYFFLDDSYNRLYEAELRFGSIFNAFTVLALFIACLGLFGLSAFTIQQRTKELGIRKVLGASVTQILTLVNQNFVKLLVFSFMVAAPIAWYVMNQWLQNFVYRIEIGFGVFLITGIGIMLMTVLTISYQSFKATMVNPVESLRSE